MLELRDLKADAEIFLSDADATEAIGKKLAEIVKSPSIVFLQGELGAGKTTIVRGFLRGLGYKGTVKSPTFTLVEPYQFESNIIYHFDLYRLNSPAELELMGIRDYFTDDAIVLVEWPEKGLGFLPKPDLILDLSLSDDGRKLKIYV